MKRFVAVFLLLASLFALAGCELTISRTKTEYDRETNTIRRTTEILPDLDKQLNELFGN